MTHDLALPTKGLHLVYLANEDPVLAKLPPQPKRDRRDVSIRECSSKYPLPQDHDFEKHAASVMFLVPIDALVVGPQAHRRISRRLRCRPDPPDDYYLVFLHEYELALIDAPLGRRPQPVIYCIEVPFSTGYQVVRAQSIRRDNSQALLGAPNI